MLVIPGALASKTIKKIKKNKGKVKVAAIWLQKLNSGWFWGPCGILVLSSGLVWLWLLFVVFAPRLFYMVAVFFVFRMRFYAAWCGAEASCISAGLGCYPEKSLSKPGGGPTVNYRYSKEAPSRCLTGRETSQTAHAQFSHLINQCQPWSHRIGVVRLQNHSEHRLLQHRLLREGAPRHALLEHDGAVVAASLHLPQLPLQLLHSEVRLHLCRSLRLF